MTQHDDVGFQIFQNAMQANMTQCPTTYEDTTSETGSFNENQGFDSDDDLEFEPMSPKKEWRYDTLSVTLKNGKILNLRHYYDVSLVDKFYHNGMWYSSMRHFFDVHDRKKR